MTAIRYTFGSIATALAYPRVWLTLWLIVTATAALAVWPFIAAVDDELARHPGASFGLDQALDADLVRERPDAAITTFPGVLFMVLVGAFLSGGVLTRVGLRDAPFRYSLFLADCGRLLARNGRVLIGAALVALLVNWGGDALARWLREDYLYAEDPASVIVTMYLFDVRWVHLLEALDYFRGFLFLLVVFASKIAMARLALGDRRSAVGAWFFAIGRVLRRPLRTAVCLFLFAFLWLGVSALSGELTARLVEGGGNHLLGIVAGQIPILFTTVLFVALLLCARQFHGGTANATEEPDVGTA